MTGGSFWRTDQTPQRRYAAQGDHERVPALRAVEGGAKISPVAFYAYQSKGYYASRREAAGSHRAEREPCSSWRAKMYDSPASWRRLNAAPASRIRAGRRSSSAYVGIAHVPLRPFGRSCSNGSAARARGEGGARPWLAIDRIGRATSRGCQRRAAFFRDALPSATKRGRDQRRVDRK